MKKNRKEIAFIACFVVILAGMMLGMLVPVAARRLHLISADTAPDLTEEADYYKEPVAFWEKYPFEASIEDTLQNETIFGKIRQKENGLKEQIAMIESAVNDLVPGRTGFIEAYIQLQKLRNSRYIDGDDVVVRMNNGQLTFLSDRLSEEEIAICAEQMLELKQMVQNQGADFLYVQTPNKINKYDNALPAGVRDYANANADALLTYLKLHETDILDLRETIAEELEFDDAFYISDHHWKPQTGLWAAKKIADRLKEAYGIFTAGENCDIHAYKEEVYEDIFLGALGKKTGKGYVPLDDMSILTPTFPTDLQMEIVGSGACYEGDFIHTFINEKQLERGDYYVQNPYAAYFRDDQALVQVVNKEISSDKTDKILLLKDSFGLTVAPFLATAVGELDVIDLRYFNGSLVKYIQESKPDMVVVMYNPKAITVPAGYHADLFDFH